MKIKTLALALILTCSPLISLTNTPNACAQPTERMADLSDLDRQLLNLPFTIIDYHTYKEGYITYQSYRFAESKNKIEKYLLEQQQKRNAIGGFYIDGKSHNTQLDALEYVFAYKNEHHSVMLKSDGAGSQIIFETTPRSIRFAVFQITFTGYTLPSGLIIPAGKNNHNCIL